MAIENNALITNVVDNFVLPFIVAVIIYWLSSKRDEYKKRKSYSRLGVAVIESLIEEVETGYKILLQAKSTGKAPLVLPQESWFGMETISDDVLLRIIEVSKGVEPRDFLPREIRIHCKNYFVHITKNFINAISMNDVGSLFQGADKFDEAAHGVLEMLKQTKELLENNTNKWFPK